MTDTDKYEINSEIVFSTAHITESDSEELLEISINPAKIELTVYGFAYGYRVYVSKHYHTSEYISKMILKGDSELSNEFWKLLLIAVKQKCKWLVFDEDGKIYKHLPTFDW